MCMNLKSQSKGKITQDFQLNYQIFCNITNKYGIIKI